MLYFRGQQVKDVNDYCRCQRSGSITSEEEEWGYWDVCCDCGKPLENGFHYYNHYDGEVVLCQDLVQVKMRKFSPF